MSPVRGLPVRLLYLAQDRALAAQEREDLAEAIRLSMLDASSTASGGSSSGPSSSGPSSAGPSWAAEPSSAPTAQWQLDLLALAGGGVDALPQQHLDWSAADDAAVVDDVDDVDDSVSVSGDSLASSTLDPLTGDRDECVVCLARRRTTLVVPCGHRHYCHDCATQLLQQSRPCAVCQTPVTTVVKVLL